MLHVMHPACYRITGEKGEKPRSRGRGVALRSESRLLLPAIPHIVCLSQFLKYLSQNRLGSDERERQDYPGYRQDDEKQGYYQYGNWSERFHI